MENASGKACSSPVPSTHSANIRTPDPRNPLHHLQEGAYGMNRCMLTYAPLPCRRPAPPGAFAVLHPEAHVQLAAQEAAHEASRWRGRAQGWGCRRRAGAGAGTSWCRPPPCFRAAVLARCKSHTSGPTPPTFPPPPFFFPPTSPFDSSRIQICNPPFTPSSPYLGPPPPSLFATPLSPLSHREIAIALLRRPDPAQGP